MLIRKASLKDVSCIAKVKVDTWRTAYKNIVSKQFLDKLSYEDSEKAFSDLLNSKQNEGIIGYVAEIQGGNIIGFIIGGFERSSHADFKGEIYALYVQKEFQRKGAGQLLIKALVQELVFNRISNMLVWTPASSPYRHFYEFLNGQEIGKKTVKIGDADVVLVAFGWKDIKCDLLKLVENANRTALIKPHSMPN
jgi:GNAT superfamily N-acetyltransferase